MADHDPSPGWSRDHAARQAIVEVVYRYCRGVDRMDRDLVLSCWHDGGTADYGEVFQGTAPGFVDWLWPVHESFRSHSHQIANVLVDVDGDRAVSESYVTVVLGGGDTPDGLVDVVDRGRYLDRWTRRAGRWAIDHRQHVSDLSSVYAVVSRGSGVSGTSRRNTADPSYALFDGFHP